MKSKPKLDTEKLRDPETRKNFQLLTSNLLRNKPSSLSNNIGNKWKDIKETVNKAAEIFKENIRKPKTRGSMTYARMQSKKEAKPEVKLYRMKHQKINKNFKHLGTKLIKLLEERRERLKKNL